MTTITLKNIPDDLYARLKKMAEINRRSINSEIIFCIEQAVTSRRIEPQAILDKARLLREQSNQYVMSNDEIDLAKNRGRL